MECLHLCCSPRVILDSTGSAQFTGANPTSGYTLNGTGPIRFKKSYAAENVRIDFRGGASCK
ncbi:hypothetical protein G1C97_2092 [Bifidobacterium sp. DSM 109959]|uniref:Uncharacterized protein n=1 Tax=Bifidobacterium olomucense TaxID=2675324 RepID=A0A7Y0EZA8_9BIFI|nr:hypothetical protein [Bifidobacterium sp. DSM 109959]